MLDIVKRWLADLKAEYVGAALATMLVGVVRAVGPALAKHVTARFKRDVKEIEALGDRVTETAQAAELFTRDAQIQRLHGLLVEKQQEIDTLERQNKLLTSHVRVIEDSKADLEERLANLRVERATDRHKMLAPSAPISTQKKLPPLPPPKKQTT